MIVGLINFYIPANKIKYDDNTVKEKKNQTKKKMKKYKTKNKKKNKKKKEMKSKSRYARYIIIGYIS